VCCRDGDRPHREGIKPSVGVPDAGKAERTSISVDHGKFDYAAERGRRDIPPAQESQPTKPGGECATHAVPIA